MEIEGTKLIMTRGDSEGFDVACETDTDPPVAIPLVEGDTIYFSVKDSLTAKAYALQKIITEFDEGIAHVDILPADTKQLKYKEYVYDIQLTRADQSVTTIVPMGKLKIEGEVTDE